MANKRTYTQLASWSAVKCPVPGLAATVANSSHPHPTLTLLGACPANFIAKLLAGWCAYAAGGSSCSAPAATGGSAGTSAGQRVR